MAYEAYTVFRVETGEEAGGVEARSPEEAVYRLYGGEWGRADFVARAGNDRPMAAPGLTSYRYAGRNGFVMIGARDTADALEQARLSIWGEVDQSRLEVWSADALTYVKA